MQARYYDPVIGRFLSNDPVGFAEGGVDYFNRYAYTANNPVNAVDPDGEFFNIVAGFLGGAAVGAAIEAGVQAANFVSSGGKTGFDGAAIGKAAAIGGATGALGPAGGAALRGALVGKGAISASKAATAVPNGKALVAVTDSVADVVGQTAVAVGAAIVNGSDAGDAAVSSLGATAGGQVAELATSGGSQTQGVKGGLRGAAVTLAKKATGTLLTGVASKGSGDAVQQKLDDLDNQ